MSGIRRQLTGNISTTSRGQKYVDEVNAKLSPESIAQANAETQSCEE